MKIQKGCKGIGRFLWLKAFESVHIKSIYCESGKWFRREFDFTLGDEIQPIENNEELNASGVDAASTEIILSGFNQQYRDEVALSLESLAKKIIEHCLPYFIMDNCPEILLSDNLGECFNLNRYYRDVYHDTLHRDVIKIKGKCFSIYHMMLDEGAGRHELHLCANNREVKSYDLSKEIPNLNKKIVSGTVSYYYVGYVTGDYLDEAVDADRYEFHFLDAPLLDGISENEFTVAIFEAVRKYLGGDLDKIREEKKRQIDEFVRYKKPQYRYLLNNREGIYDAIPVGLSEGKLDLELYKQEQIWEYDVAKKCKEIERKQKSSATKSPEFMELFHQYCADVTHLSQASLAEYIVRRKAVIDLLEKALECDEDETYSKESTIHSIICPMQISSDDVQFDEMNLWLIDDRLAYHNFLSSDKPMRSLPILQSDVMRRMDIAVFDKAISYSADADTLNSITIIELKRPQRDDLEADDKNPINQVLKYVADIKAGTVKRANGRDFGNVGNAAFYCYIIADITNSLKEDAANAGLNRTPDGEGFFGFNAPRGAYIEVISYTKLVKDAKQRNEILFDKLFRPKASQLIELKRE